MVLDVFEVGLHRPVMRPLVGHEIMKLSAGVVAAVTAEINAPVPGAFPKFALFHPIIDMVAETAITVRCSARTAKKTTGTASRGFHGEPFFNRRIIVMLFLRLSSCSPHKKHMKKHHKL
jgi:hypothetical protein